MSKSWWLALAATLVVLGFNPNRAQAVALPYDTDENKLIDRKLGKVNPGDPQWLVDGKFYDVGRNPDPLPGNVQTDWGDYRFRVTHIKFDWSSDVGAGDETGEGLELWRNQSTTLDHITDGRIKGEWIYNWANDDAKGRHEPALYACKEAVTIRVRVECADAISSAEIGAKQVPDANALALWRDVQKTKVQFFEKIPGALWVSKGPLLNPDEPDLGFSEYVDMPLSGPIRDDINKTLCTWQWYVDGTSAAGTPPGTPRFANDVCKNSMKGWEINRSEGYEVVTHDDGTTTETAVPQTFYTVLGKPNNPYYREAGSGLTEAFPWVTALEFAIVTHVKLAGVTDAGVACTKIANFCYAGYGLECDHKEEMSLWVTGTRRLGTPDYYLFQFSNFIASGGGKMICCFDQACAVCTLGDLTTGMYVDVHWLPEFGYVPQTTFVGGIEANNPFWDDISYVSDKIVGQNDTRWRANSAGRVKRSAFDCHVWCEIQSGTVYDATVGNGASACIQPDRTSYKAVACDVSNTGAQGMDWRDDEKVARKREGTIQPYPPAPWLSDGYQDTVYSIAADDEGFQAEHANMSRVKRKDLNLE